MKKPARKKSLKDMNVKDLKDLNVQDLKDLKVQIKVPSVVTRIARGRVSNRLAIVAAMLVVAIVAVPIALSKSSSPSQVPVAQLPPSEAPPVEQMPAVTVSNTPSTAPLNGKARDPFTQPNGSSNSSSEKTHTTTTSTTPSTTTTPSSPTSSSSPNTGSGSNPNNTAPPFNSLNPSGSKPKPPVGQLTATQAYYVSFSMTEKSGGVKTIPSLERLSPVPSREDPMMVELGVLEGGKQVLFALQPGAVVTGGGTCIPGPVDCQILSVGRGQVEKLSARTQAGLEPLTYFSVTSIAAQHYSSAAAAQTARKVASSFGHELLVESNATALSLFQFEPGVGVIVDKRNLTVGG